MIMAAAALVNDAQVAGQDCYYLTTDGRIVRLESTGSVSVSSLKTSEEEPATATDKKERLRVEDFIEILTLFKCRACSFTSGQKEPLCQHIQAAHLSAAESSVVEKSGSMSQDPVEEVEAEEEGDQQMQYSLEEDEHIETVVLEETPREKDGQYFKFFLVREQKEIFICSICSLCQTSEEKIQAHVERHCCLEARCRNCGQEFLEPNGEYRLAEYNQHLQRCRPALFRISSVPPDKEVSPEEEAVNSLEHLEEYYEPGDKEAKGDGQEVGGGEAEAGAAGPETVVMDEYKVARLKRNRTDLELNSQTRVWVCSVKSCYAIFKQEKNLDYHMTCHKGESFSCPVCGIESGKWPDLCSHLYKEHGVDCDLYQCFHCGEYRTASVAALERHYQTHANLKMYECDLCFKGFNQLCQLKNHSVIHLREKSAELPNWARPKQCDLCKRTFSDSKSLKKHVQAIHSQLKPYICQICGFQSSRKANLRMHVRQHSGEKPYACTECEYRTGDHNSLRRHKSRHTGVKHYKCDFCDFSSIQSVNFRRHMQRKHGVEPPSRRNAGGVGGDGEPLSAAVGRRGSNTSSTTVQLATVMETEEKSPAADAAIASHEKQQQQPELEEEEDTNKEISLNDPLDSIFALAYKSLEPGVP